YIYRFQKISLSTQKLLAISLKNIAKKQNVVDITNTSIYIISHDVVIVNTNLKIGGFMLYTEKRIEIKINDLIRKEDISLRKLGRLADIDISSLSKLSRGERKRVDLGHLKRIAEALDINDMNEILSIVNVEEEK